MTVIYITYNKTVSDSATAPWSYNNFYPAETTPGALISSNLNDDSNNPTGYTLTAVNGVTGSFGGSTTATAGAGTWPEDVFDNSWYFGAGGETHRLGGLTDGSTYTIEAAGHAADPARDTDFTIGGTTTRYDSAGTGAPNAPISFSGTVSGTTLDIDMAIVSTFGYINGLKITINEPSGRSITNIDGDNDVQAGQTSVTINTVGMDASPTVKTATLGGESLTVISAGATEWVIDIPLHINLEWGSTTNAVELTDDTGAVTGASNVTLSAPTGWETVTFTSAPDPGTTESFYEKSQTDADVGNFTAAVNDILAWETQSGLTVDAQTIPVVDPPNTVSGAYKWWDVSLSTFTTVSSFTITNGGIFGASSQIILRDVLRSPLSSPIKSIFEE